MKKYVWPSVKLTLILIVICSVLYPLFIAGIAKLAPGGGKGETVTVNGKVVGYANIGQKFTEDKYFWSRPSAVDYNAAGSAGSEISQLLPPHSHLTLRFSFVITGLNGSTGLARSSETFQLSSAKTH